MFIPLFGLERELHDSPDAAKLVEEVIARWSKARSGSTSTMATSPPWPRIASGL